MIPETITITIELGGKPVCGMEGKPESCLDCSELPNCVLDNFYETTALIREEYRKKKEDDEKKKNMKNACHLCGKEMVKHIIKEGSRYHVTWWDSRGGRCTELNCENNHGYGLCVPRCEYPRNEDGN